MRRGEGWMEFRGFINKSNDGIIDRAITRGYPPFPFLTVRELFVIESWSFNQRKSPYAITMRVHGYHGFPIINYSEGAFRQAGETYAFRFPPFRTQTNRIVDKNKRDGVAINERDGEDPWLPSRIPLEEFKLVWKDRHACASLADPISLPLFLRKYLRKYLWDFTLSWIKLLVFFFLSRTPFFSLSISKCFFFLSRLN